MNVADGSKAILERNRKRREAALARVTPLTAENPLVADVVEDLASARSIASLELDPYWPKWDSPWWKMLLLQELGLAEAIPPSTVNALVASIERTYIKTFPLVEAELPEGIDGWRNIICHCALGTIYRLLLQVGFHVDDAFPWMRPWFWHYQLSDGGLNCEESVYTRDVPRSSFLSTLPPLEAVLAIDPMKRSYREEEFLERGAIYLIARRLCRSLSKGEILIDPTWLEPIFPRFYHYDVLRGLAFVARWARTTESPIAGDTLVEALAAVDARLSDEGTLCPRAQDLVAEGTLSLGPDGTWSFGAPATLFPLLVETSGADLSSAALTLQWYDTVEDIAFLDEKGLLA